MLQNHIEAHHRPENVQEHLHHVGPDDGRHAAFKRVKKRQADDQDDRSHLPGAQDDRDDDGDRKHPDSLRQAAHHQKGARGEPPQPDPEAPLHQLVGGERLAAEIVGQKQSRNRYPRQQVPEDHLQEGQVAGESQSGGPNDGQSAGFGRDDRQRDGPPGRVSPAQI